MSFNIKVEIPLHKKYDESFINLDENNVDKIYSDIDPLTLNKDLLINSGTSMLSNKKYMYKNICIEYVDNVSEPYVKVPNSDNFRYLVKQDNEYLFSETNPKKTEVFTSDFLDSIEGTRFNLTNAMIAKELYTNNNTYKVYSLPFGGIDKNDSHFYCVDMEGNITKLYPQVDYAEGLIYIYYEGRPYEEEQPSMVFIFCLGNLVPLKITAKGHMKIEEENSSFFKISNIPNKNYVSLEYIDDSVIMTTLKDILLRVPSDSDSITIDGVNVVKDQYMFLSRNETILLRRENIEADTTNIDYLSTNNNLVDSLAMSYKEDNIVLNNESRDNNYFIEIVNKENKNTYMKETPILIKLFNSVKYYAE